VPLTYRTDPDRAVADVVAAGPVTLEEAIRTIRTVAGELSQHQCGCLTDAREMDFYPSVTELKEIAFEFVRLRAAFRCGIAFVVSNERHYSLGRLLSALVDSSGLRIGTFYDKDEAEQWLKNLVDVHLGKPAPA